MAESPSIKPFGPGSVVRARRHELAWRRAGDEVVILDLVSSTYRSLNATGALLWERLADWASTNDLTAVLINSHGLELSAAERDVLAFLDGCHHAGLLETRESP
jgi:hypothetical protein